MFRRRGAAASRIHPLRRPRHLQRAADRALHDARSGSTRSSRCTREHGVIHRQSACLHARGRQPPQAHRRRSARLQGARSIRYGLLNPGKMRTATCRCGTERLVPCASSTSICHPAARKLPRRDPRRGARRTDGSRPRRSICCDLYAERFDPVLSAEERRDYHDIGARTSAAVDRLRASGCARPMRWSCQFPVWSFGPPAMLKGWIDRLLMPGVAFDLSDPAACPAAADQPASASPASRPTAGRGGTRSTSAIRRSKIVTRYLPRFTGEQARRSTITRSTT